VGELLFNKSLSEAEEIALETLVILRRARAPQEDLIANANANLGAVLTGQGRYDEAETLLLEAESEQKRVSYRPSDDRAMQFTLQKLQDLYQRWNKPDQFFKLLERKTAETTRALGATPSDAVMLASRGKLLARMGKFEDAKVDYLKAIELAPSQDLNWHDGAVPLLLQLDKPEEYVRLRTRELKQFANTSDLAAAHRVSKDCFMMPLEGEELDQAVALAARGKYGDDTWAAQTKGMADYRRGRFYDAIKWLKFSTDGKAAWKDVENNLFIALAYHYLGQHKEAQETLDGAVKMMETRLPQAGKADLGSPGDWIYCQIMRREAEREINGKDTSVTRGAASRPSTFPAGAADSPPLRADGDGVLTPPPPRPATSQPR
jgi:tetratricopeptide (TPR) repeat protein